MNVEVLTDSVAVLAAGDASATRTVYAVVAALGVIGVALIVLAVWLIKQTRPERELLAPLERMHDRSWLKQSPAQMRRDLDEVRPLGAHPVRQGKELPVVDDDFEQNRPALATFDDLQAQLAADARHRPSSGTDPLLVPPTAAASGSAQADSGTGVDAGADVDATAGTVRPEVPADDGDGTVTHSARGSAGLAALAQPVDDVDTDPDMDVDTDPDIDVDTDPDQEPDIDPDQDPDGTPEGAELPNGHADD